MDGKDWMNLKVFKIQKMNKSLQKFTDLQMKYQGLLNLELITRSELESLSNTEKDEFCELCSHILNRLDGDERDIFLSKIDVILSQRTKNEIWEYNHMRIVNEITSFIEEYGRMPTLVDLRGKLSLSRQTLHKHLKEYKRSPKYIEHISQFQFMGEKLLAKLFQFSLRGDVKAARLYFDIIGNPSRINNNYIQINNLVISEDKLRKLNSDQILKIQEIIEGN